jgi:hypothetical protein
VLHAFVVFSFKAEGIEDLALVAVLEVDAGVGSVLASAQGFEGEEEFEVEGAVAELFLRSGAGGEEASVVGFGVNPFGHIVFGGEEHVSAFGGLGAEGGALALDLI